MTLSKEQIEQLFTFTKKKFVHWYDLQVELVDHLANKIEAEMEGDAGLTFERALSNVYASFGIFGFAKIVSERQEALRKANNKLLLKEIVEQFTWPNLVRSLAVLAAIFTIAFEVNIKTVAVLTLAIYFLDIAFIGRNSLIKFRLLTLKKSKTKTARKKNLLILQNLPAFSFAGIIYLQFMLMRYFKVLFVDNENFSAGFKIYFSILLFLGILINGSAKKVSQGILNKAKQLYPEAFA